MTLAALESQQGKILPQHLHHLWHIWQETQATTAELFSPSTTAIMSSAPEQRPLSITCTVTAAARKRRVNVLNMQLAPRGGGDLIGMYLIVFVSRSLILFGFSCKL